MLRLPFKWERVQPTLNGTLDPTNLGYLKTFVAYAATKGAKVILDCHNFGGYVISGVEHKIGGGLVTGAHLADFWTKLATEFLSATNIYAYDIMNEPSNMPTTTAWPTAAQLVINAIDAVDTTKTIMIEGDGFSSAYAWIATNPTLHLLTSHSPLQFSAHSYPDRDSSGTHSDWATEVLAGDLLDPTQPAVLDTTILVKRLSPFLQWGATYGKSLHVGELGIPNSDPNWLKTGFNALTLLQQNNVPYTIWSGGPGWGLGYAYSVEPGAWVSGYTGALDANQMAMLTQFTGAAQPTSYALTGPSNGAVSTPSTFTVTYQGLLASGVTFTFNDNGAGGSFSSTVTLASGGQNWNPSGSVTYTPPAGAMTTRIDITNDGGLTDPTGVVFSTEVDLFAGLATPVNIISDIQLYAAYIGPCRNMRRTSDGATLDFNFAGQALGVANLGRVLDYAAIATWAPGGATTVRRYSQEPTGNHLGPLVNTDAPPSTTADYPAFSIDTDGFPTDTFASSRMEMVSSLHGATGQTIIANFNYTSGSDVLNWDFVSAIQFGPSVYQYSDGTQDHLINEQGAMSLGVLAGEYHVYASTWQANTVDGWRTWRDGVQIGTNRAYATVLTADFNRPYAHLGFNVFLGTTWAGKSRDWIVWNTSISDAANLAIQNYLATHYSTVQPTTITPKIVMDFAADTYTVNGVASTLTALTSGTRSRNSTGLLADGTTSLAGAALAMFAGTDYTIIVEQGECATATPANNAGVLVCSNGAKVFNTYVSTSFVFNAGTGGGATGGSQVYNIDNVDLRLTQRYGLSRTAGTWRTAVNGIGQAVSAASLDTGWTAVALGNSFFGGRIHKITITDSASSAIQLLTATDMVGTPGTPSADWSPGVNEAGGEFNGGPFWPLNASIDYYHERGLKNIRLPFHWEVVQTSLNAALDATALVNLDRIITRATGYGMTVILDCHNYGGYPDGSVPGKIGAGTVTSAHLADLFGKLATRYAANDLVAYDLMNEPTGPLTQAQWYSVCSDSKVAIRAAGANGIIFVPSYGGSSGATRFVPEGNAAAFLASGYTDTNSVITVHRYLDNDGAGDSSDTTRFAGRGGLRSIVRWCRENGQRFHVGEVGAAVAPSIPLGITEFIDMLAFMYESRDVCWGYDWWSGGSAWGGGYFQALEPLNPSVNNGAGWVTPPYGERPQMGIMRMFL